MHSSKLFWPVEYKCALLITRELSVSPRLLLEPTNKKADPGTLGLKHSLVTCESKWICPEPKPLIKDEWPKPRVAIVGAGMAGLAAAWKLIKGGVKDVVIIEALARPGGRVNTSELSGTKVDLGANTVYGTTISNPLHNIAIMENLAANNFVRKFVRGPYYNSHGDIVFDIIKPYEIFTSAINEASSIFKNPKQSKTSLKDFIAPRLKRGLSTVSELQNHDSIVCVMTGMENEVRVRWGDELSNISTSNIGSYIEIPNGFVKLSKGADVLLKPFLSVIGNRIKYKKPVQCVRWGIQQVAGTKRASVLCCDGEEFECDFVISTVSLGVLKSQAESLFSPTLPKSKMESIGNIGFGHIDKIFLEYDKPFWAPNEGVIKIGWNPEELQKRDDWIKGVGSIVEESPNVLKVSIAGREAVWAESCTDKSIAEDMTRFLRKLTGDPAIPCPKSILRSRWSSDIYFLGAQSYLGLSSSVEDQCELGRPLPNVPSVPPVLLFAGEATMPGHFSTMHGAVLSGYREADRIIDICHKLEGFPRPKQKLK